MKLFFHLIFVVCCCFTQTIVAQNDPPFEYQPEGMAPKIPIPSGSDFRSKPPVAGKPAAIQMGKSDVFTLDNGLTVIVVENFKLPKLSVRLFVDAGPIAGNGAAGYKQVFGELLKKGTRLRTKTQIDEEIDFMGGSLTADENGISGQCLVKHADRFLAVVSDIMLHANFPATEFDKAVKKLQNDLSNQVDDPDLIAQKVGATLCFGNTHPYGEMATPQSAEQISLEVVKNYYSTYFKPNNSYLVLTGYLAREQAEQYAKKYFGKWPSAPKPGYEAPQVKAPISTKVSFVHKPGAVQSVVNITYPVMLPPDHPDVIPVRLTNTILGGYFNSRVNQTLRESKGWTYGAESQLRPDPVCSYFSGKMSVRNSVTDSAIGTFLNEMRRLRNEPLQAKELNVVKNVVLGQFSRSLEDPALLAEYVMNTLRYKLPSGFYENYLTQLQRITASEIQQIANEYFLPDKANILVVGDKESVADQLTHYSADHAIKYYDPFGEEVMINNLAIPADLTADKIIEDYVNAIGGRENIVAVRDFYTKVLMKTRGPEFVLRTWQKNGIKIAIEMKLNEQVVSRQTFDGYVGQHWGGINGLNSIDGEPLNDLKEQALFCKEAWYFQNGYNIILKGTEVINGKNAFRIEVIRADGKKSIEYYDMKTSLKLREVNISVGSDLEPFVMLNDFDDYRAVAGVLLPHTTTVAGVFPVPFQLLLEEARANTNIQDNIFKQ